MTARREYPAWMHEPRALERLIATNARAGLVIIKLDRETLPALARAVEALDGVRWVEMHRRYLAQRPAPAVARRLLQLADQFRFSMWPGASEFLEGIAAQSDGETADASVSQTLNP